MGTLSSLSSSPMPYTTSPMPLTSASSPRDPLEKPTLTKGTRYPISQKIGIDSVHVQPKNNLDVLQAAVTERDQKTQEKFERVWFETLGELVSFRAKLALYNDSFSMKNKETVSEWSPAYAEIQKKDEQEYQNLIKISQTLDSITADRIKALNTTENRLHFFRLLAKHQLHGNSSWVSSKLFTMSYRYGAQYRMTEIEGLLTQRSLALQSKDKATDSSTPTSQTSSEESDLRTTSDSILEELASLSQKIVILKEDILTYNETLKELPLPVIAASSYQDQLKTAETLKTTFAKLEESITKELKDLKALIEIQTPLTDSFTLSDLLARQAELHSKKKLIETRIGEIFNLLEERRKQYVLEKPDASDSASSKWTSNPLKLLADLVSLKETLKAEADWEKHLSPTKRKALYEDAMVKSKTLKASLDLLIKNDPESIKKQEQEEDRIKRAVAIFSTLQNRFKEEKAKLDLEMGKRKAWVLPLSSSSLTLESPKPEETTNSSTTATTTTTSPTLTREEEEGVGYWRDETEEETNDRVATALTDLLNAGYNSSSTENPQEHKEGKSKLENKSKPKSKPKSKSTSRSGSKNHKVYSC